MSQYFENKMRNVSMHLQFVLIYNLIRDTSDVSNWFEN